MTTLLWIAAAWAGPPPAGLNLDDPYGWDEVARAVVDGPPGCHDASGIARFVVTLYQMPDLLAAPQARELVFGGHVDGTLSGGTWTAFSAQLVQLSPPPKAGEEEEEDAGSDLLPLVGTRPEKQFRIRSEGSEVNLEGDDVPLNLVRQAVDEWGGDQETVVAEWSSADDGVVSRRELPVSKKSRDTSRIETFFPGGGRLATRFDVTFPETVTVGDWPARARLQRAQMHLRQEVRDGAAWPTFESTSVVINVLGFTIGIEQTIQWQGWTSCAGGPG